MHLYVECFERVCVQKEIDDGFNSMNCGTVNMIRYFRLLRWPVNKKNLAEVFH